VEASLLKFYVPTTVLKTDAAAKRRKGGAGADEHDE
jgi:hypothetical protein